MVRLTRRNFLALLGLGLFVPGALIARSRRKIVAAKDAETALMLIHENGRTTPQLLAMNGVSWQACDIPMPNSSAGGGPHSIEVNPANPAQIAIFPMLGDSLVLFSLKENRVLHKVKAKEGFHFSGHGLFTLDGEHFLACEAEPQDKKGGFISLRKSSTGELVEEIHTGAIRPHHLTPLDSGMEMLAVAHYGKQENFVKSDLQSEVSYLDWKSRKITHRVKSSAPNEQLCHIVGDKRNKGEVFVSSLDRIRVEHSGKTDSIFATGKYFPAPVLSVSLGSSVPTILDAKNEFEKFSFNFSIALSEKHNRLAVVHMVSKSISFWEASGKKLIEMKAYPELLVNALNTSLSEDQFVVGASSSTALGKIIYYDAATLAVAKEVTLPIAGRIGGHMGLSRFPV